MYYAKVLFYKQVEKDNYYEGCHGGLNLVYEDILEIEFKNKQDFVEKLAKYTSENFDVDEKTFLKHVENIHHNHRFDYYQTEDENGNRMKITKENPDGYCANYLFYVADVYGKVHYKF